MTYAPAVSRQRLGLTAVGLLVLLGVVVSVVEIPALIAVPLFGVVVVLVGILFFRFHPYGDIWAEADELGVNPWVLVVVTLLAAGAWMAFRLG